VNHKDLAMSHVNSLHVPLSIIPDVSVVIPAYNEELRLGPTLERIHAFMQHGPLTYEIIVVDDGSKDGTVALAQSMTTSIANLRVVVQPKNQGKGAAVRAGMLAAKGRVRVMCDADCSMPPEEMPKLLARIASGEAEIAIGSRYCAGAEVAKKQPLYRRLWSRLANRVIQKTLVPGVLDTQCGFKAFTDEAAIDLFQRAQINGWAFDLEILALARRRAWGIAEVAVSWQDDERSRVNPLKDMWKVIKEAMTIRRNLKRGVYGQLAAAMS
jgi:dolichyl-phosphate beta-glucosyltransferase